MHKTKAIVACVACFATAIGCGKSDRKLYVSAAVVSASAFDVRVDKGVLAGKYLYSYLAPASTGPQVRSLLFNVRSRDSIIEITDSRGRFCRSWRIETLTEDLLKVNFGREIVRYVSASRSAYQQQIQALRLEARALQGTGGGGVIDYFKPICLGS